MKPTHLLFALLFSGIFIMCTPSPSSSTHKEEIQFASHGDSLSGTIVFPDNMPIHAGIVFVHGSGKQQRDLDLARKFAGQGIAALVYDKRGVGKSGGTYVQNSNVSEQNLNLLADDAVAAMTILRQHKKLTGIPIGLTGISQAGWIVPLAAVKFSAVDFIGLWSGPVCKVSEEDIFSKHTSDSDLKTKLTFAQVKKMRKQPYYWPEQFGIDTDPAESLRLLSIPGFWIFGGNDGSIPVDLSIERLEALQKQGNENFHYVLVPDLGHATTHPTFLTMTDWIKKTVNLNRL